MSLSTPRLSDIARHVIAPSGVVSTGWPAVRDTCARLGWVFDPWQDGAGRLILGKRSDGLYAADLVALSIGRQVGKALDLDTQILTANRGWTTMRGIKVGDEVLHPSGKRTAVTFVSDVMHERDCFEVVTTDGRRVVADAEHLWTVTDKRKRSLRTLTTAEMFSEGVSRYSAGHRSTSVDGKRYRVNEYRFALPRQCAVDLPPRDLPIDPYLFGAWLGDGTGVHGRMSSGDEDLDHWLKAIRLAGYIPKPRRGKTCWNVGITSEPGAGRHGRSFVGKLRRLGVLGNKHIPEDFLCGSTEQRLALLQGLMDTDGSIDRRGVVEFCSVTRNLADGVLFLARSLGWRAYMHEGRAAINGRDCGPRYRVTFTPKLVDGPAPFRLDRKAIRVGAEDRNSGRMTVSIKEIVRVPSRPVRCIKVAEPDGLFLAGRDLVATHNTFLFGAMVFAMCLREPGLTVIWTAHRAKTAKETFSSMSGMAAQERVAPHIAQVVRSRGDEAVVFGNGSRVLFGARESGFGRGFSNVGILVFDEAQILTESAMEDMVAAQNVARNPLTILTGTPPRPKDPGEVFTMVRQEALSGDSEGSLYIELSADRDADLLDRSQWRRANPSFPVRTSERAMLRMKKNLSEDSFRREALGVWDDISVHKPIVTPQQWKQMADVGPADDVRPDALGVDMSHGRDISIAACWVEGESAHVEQVWAGSDPVAAMDWLAGMAGRRVPVVVDQASPAASFVPELKNRRCTVVSTGAQQMAQACGLFENRIATDTLTHGAQKQVTDAVLGARRRPIRDAGGWALDRSDPSSSIYPIVAAVLALFGATSFKRQRSGSRVVVLS